MRERELVGGRDRDRTGDPLLAKQVLSQLSYTPTEELLFILKHFPIFCCLYPWLLDLDRAFTMQDTLDLLDRAQSTNLLNR